MAEAFGEVDELCRAAVSDGTVPGLVVGATDQGRQQLLASWGWAALEPHRVPATVATDGAPFVQLTFSAAFEDMRRTFLTAEVERKIVEGVRAFLRAYAPRP